MYNPETYTSGNAVLDTILDNRGMNVNIPIRFVRLPAVAHMLVTLFLLSLFADVLNG